MKLITTFFVSIFFTLSGFSQYGQSQNGLPVVTLSFTANGNRAAYQVTIDGTNYYSSNTATTNNGNWNNNGNNNTNNNIITLDNLQVGQHNLQVFRLRNNGGNNTVNNNNSQPTYTNTFNLRQGYDMSITVKNGQVQYTETAIKKNRRSYGDNDGNRRDRNEGYNNGGYTNAGYNQTPMADDQFSQLLQSVRSKLFQSAKVSAEKDIFNTTTNYFTSYQITQLLQMISAENTQLEVAKLSYRSVTDPANFNQVSNLFSNNQTYKNDIDTYIRSNGGYSNGGGYNNGGYNNGGYNNGGYNRNRIAMQDANFNQLLQKANNHFLPRDKVNDVRSDLNNTGNYFSTSQIRQLLSILTNEADRLELAKLAYRTVTDASNFLQLTDLFVNLSYRNDLENYVKSYRR